MSRVHPWLVGYQNFAEPEVLHQANAVMFHVCQSFTTEAEANRYLAGHPTREDLERCRPSYGGCKCTPGTVPCEQFDPEADCCPACEPHAIELCMRNFCYVCKDEIGDDGVWGRRCDRCIEYGYTEPGGR
jgi:hypothetical protein